MEIAGTLNVPLGSIYKHLRVQVLIQKETIYLDPPFRGRNPRNHTCFLQTVLTSVLKLRSVHAMRLYA